MTMQKIKTMSLCMLLLIGCLLTGCANKGQGADGLPQTYNGEAIQPKLSKINMPFELVVDESRNKSLNMYTVCYSDEDCFLVANVNDNIVTATSITFPDIRTNGVYMVKYDKSNSSTLYDIKSDKLIYSAVPYKEGIVYANSKAVGEEPLGENAFYKWSITYFDGKTQKELDSGYSKHEFAAEITMAGEVPVYCCERVNKEDEIEVSINKIVDLEPENIEILEGFEKDSIIQPNGKSYLIELYDSKNKKTLLVAGDEESVKVKHELEDQINSSSITENYIVASLGGEMGKTTIEGIPLGKSEAKDFSQTKRWWRMVGSGGKYCLVVDDGFNPYYINIEDGLVGEVILSEEMENDPNCLVKYFHPAGKDRYILSINYEDFYIMDLNS